MKLRSLSESIDNRAPKIAIYGESGTGKTTQLAAIWQLVPDDRKFLIITAEHGLRSLRHACPEMLDAENIVVAECHSVAEVKEAVAFASDPANAVAWCAVDSVSNVAERELRARLESAGDPRQAYGAVQVGTLGVLWSLVDVQHVGVLFIFQETRKEVNVGTAKRPEMENHYSMTVPSDALKQSVPYTFDAVMRLELKADGTRQFRTAKTSTIMAKDRTGKLLPLEAADMGAIIEKILA